MLDPGSTGGAVGNGGAPQHNLTDPCWLLDRATRLLHHDPRPVRAALAPLGRSMADALSALRYQAGTCGEPLGEVVSQTITHLRLWAGAVAAETEPRRGQHRQGAALSLPPPPGHLAQRGGRVAGGEVEGALT